MGLAAIGAGAALAMGGASAIGATAAAITAGTLSALSVGTVLTAVATVGAVVGAVGKIAGVKELQTAGMVLGGIGGIGSLANAVGAFGEGATIGSIFGGGGVGEMAGGGDFIGASNSIINGEQGVSSAAGIDGDFIGTSLDTGTGQIAQQGNNFDIISSAAKLAGGNVMSPETTQLAGTEGPAGNADTGVIQQKLTSGASMPLAKQNNTDIVEGPTSDDNTGTATKSAGANVTGKVDINSGQKPEDKPSFWSTQNGSLVAMGGIQAAGSFLSGAFDPLKPAQADAYSAQAAANNAQAALSNRELANMNSKIPVARRVGVTGRPSLINGAAA